MVLPENALGQSPVPADTCSASRNAASKRGAHGPWLATTNGDSSIVSYVSGSVTNERAQSSMLARSFSNDARLRKMYRCSRTGVDWSRP